MSNIPDLVDSFQNLSTSNTGQHQSQPQTPQPHTQFKEPKTNLPSSFDGTRSKFRAWKDKVRLHIQLQPISLPNDTIRIAVIYSLMTGIAEQWFLALRLKHPVDAPMFNSLTHFWALADIRFGDPNRVENARRALERCVQRGGQSASSYASEFQEIAIDCDYGAEADAYQTRCYRLGLLPAVLERMSKLEHAPASFDEYIQKSIGQDDWETNLRRSF